MAVALVVAALALQPALLPAARRAVAPRSLFVSPTRIGRAGSLIASAAEPADGRPVRAAPRTSTTAALVALWYATSCVANETSKRALALRLLDPLSLTLAQLLVASGCGALLIFGVKAEKYDGIRSAAQLRDTTTLAAAFTAGFITLNACFRAMHNSQASCLLTDPPRRSPPRAPRGPGSTSA